MTYTAYSYLWPPRPEKAIPPSVIPFYTGRGWTVQAKKNGTCTLICCRHGEAIFKTRHGDADEHKAWSPLPEHREFFGGLSDSWAVFVAELLHSKTPGIKNTFYIFDALVLAGRELIGQTFGERQELLRVHLEPKEGVAFGARHVAPYVQLATPVSPDSWGMLPEETEGFVFKDPLARLAPCVTPSANSWWQVKCRRPHKNYSF